MKILQLLILFTSLMSASNGFAELTSLEKEIAKQAESMTDDAIRLLEQVSNVNSGTMNLKGVREVGKLFRNELDALGFRTRWISMPEGMHRAGHLFAERTGNAGKTVLLIGHLDTVFEQDSPFEPFKRQGSTATGQGVSDMKGGDVVMVYALKALQKAGALENTNIIVALIGDEEMAGDPVEISRRDLIEAAKRSDVALGFEPAVGLDNATVARRGIAGWILRVKGKQAHSAGTFSPEAGSGAIFEASRILNAFHEELRGETFLTFNPGVIVGGTEVKYDSEQSRGTAFGKSNVIAQTAVVEGDIRFIANEQYQKAREKMVDIVSKNLPRTSASIEFLEGYPAMPPAEGNYAVLKKLDAVSRDLGHGPVKAFDPGGRGAADISFVAPYVHALDGLGAMGDGAHSPEESVQLDTLAPLIQRAAILIYRITHQ